MLTLAAATALLCFPLDVRLDRSPHDGIHLWIAGEALARGRRNRNADNDRDDRNDRNSNSDNNRNSDNGRSSDNARNSDTDNNARSSDNNRGSGRRDDGPRSGDRDNDSPPRTLAETIERWVKPSDDKPERPAPSTGPSSNTPPVGKKAGDETKPTPGRPASTPPGKAVVPAAGKATAKSPTPSLGISGWTHDIGNKPHAPHEILGVHLSTKGLQAVMNLGYAVPPQPKNSLGVTRLYLPQGLEAEQAQAMLQKELPKERFELNKIYRVYRSANQNSSGSAHGVVPASTAPSCTGSRCIPRDLLGWSMEELRGCSGGVSVGILDTGIDHEHPSIKHRFSGVFIPEGRKPAPSWHGTAVFALLAGNPKSGTPGLIPNAGIYHASIFFSDQSGDFATDTHVLLQALDWMENMGVKIVNMSFAGPRDALVEQMITRLSAKGMIFIAAAGNDGPTAEPAFPAAYRQVIAVTAVKADRRVYPFANRGRHIDVAAPGVDIWTAVPGAREGYYSGTSFAAPFVTALVATIYKQRPIAVKEQLLDRLEYDDLGIPGRDSTYGRGLPIAPKTCDATPAWGTTTVNGPATRPPAAVSAGFR